MIVTDNNFKKEVLESDIPVLVDFWASWCPPCKMIEPLMDKLGKEFEGRIKICKLNVDQNRKTRSDYDINNVPTFILFKKGKVFHRVYASQTECQLRNIIALGLDDN